MFFSGRRAHDSQAQGSHRSLITTLKLKFTNPFRSSRHAPRDAPFSSTIPLPAPVFSQSPQRPEGISRPRQLRRQRYYEEAATFRGRSMVQHYSHPIHRLPVELLSHIFILGSQDSAYLPVTVSHVCQHWRRIALRTPTLWRRITLSPKERMWKERIRRAKACSLDIQLLPSSSKIPKSLSRASRKYDKVVIELDPYSIQWHMHMVMPHIARWRSFEVAFPSYAPYLWKAALSRVCSPRGTQAPVLEDLRLTYRQNDDPEAFTLFSGSAPKLRSATLVGIRLNWLPSLFANLTVLDYTHHGFTVGYQAIQDVVDMLSVSSALIELHLAFPRKPSPCLPGRAQPVHARVLLSQLKRLTLRVEGPDIPYELAVLSTLLLTPSLTTLNLADPTHSYSSFTSLKQFFYAYALPRSLERVSVDWGWYDARMIEPITQGCRQIREIVVRKRGGEQVIRFPQQQRPSIERYAPSHCLPSPAAFRSRR
ncbi:hypothetical protein BKA70DRAFT_776193 [Coprinopsis sp. MPI-PUGE-AT-0042]|nr:hypothetical protein BKA70DRAFT_776193 [Coprinopsis sp. MPI-PUGE-AT-0042]